MLIASVIHVQKSDLDRVQVKVKSRENERHVFVFPYEYRYRRTVVRYEYYDAARSEHTVIPRRHCRRSWLAGCRDRIARVAPSRVAPSRVVSRRGRVVPCRVAPFHAVSAMV